MNGQCRKRRRRLQKKSYARPCYAHKATSIPDRLVELERFTQLTRATPAVAYVLRFIANLNQKDTRQEGVVGPLSSEELARAEYLLIRETQWQSIPDEILDLQKCTGDSPYGASATSKTGVIKIGRSNAKHWIAVFTCLIIRTVHVEVAHNLTTDSCIKCIRRFICRRGAPAEIYSDNGTNFLGAAKLLQDQVEQLAVTFTGTTTKWVFNPPGTPHMGGAWERMVRSDKTAVGTAYNNNRKLEDEALESFMVGAEAIVNRRPLTYLPLTSEESEALTPNHFLLGNSSGVKQHAVEATGPAEALRSSWHQVQHQLDMFGGGGLNSIR
ncbi:uncharacterized protein LOC134291729 [Aedes albopictus]|uniref:Integrase catalytic domain-containing protein n=1 Tax=Aedes albopictus TaxID=7160 RepID=A0ABM1Z0S4_AEDAL